MPPANTGHFYVLADGTHGVQYRTADGRRRKRSGFPNITAARKWHRDNVLRRNVVPSELTLRDLTDRYLDRHAKIRSAGTIQAVRERMRQALDDYGDTTLAELEQMADELADWRATLPPRYAHKQMGALRQVLAAGVRWRLLERNPALDAGENPEPDPRPIRTYTLDELDAIADELSDAYRTLPAFAAATGLRPEEWSALERRHIDRARRVIRVEQKNVDGRIEPGGKTTNSVREVPLTRRALQALDDVPARLHGTVYPAPAGGPLNLDNFRRREWAPAVEAAGVAKPARPYDLRATFISNALAGGVTVFELARIAGTSVRMIEKHYGTLIDGAHAAITSRLDALEAELERADDAEAGEA
ncbi:MAG TPA: tyrosine-type recombinase/integrase [Gaiellaceae bacterium]|jgi:integrase